VDYELWQYGLWIFQTWGTKLERFLPMNQHTQRKLLKSENWVNGSLRSFQKSGFLKSIIFICPEKKCLKLKSWLNFNAIFYINKIESLSQFSEKSFFALKYYQNFIIH
jgi:hypothetical protein